jgi:NADH pyrophosphatase NudC (nudix superfamily)
MERAGRLMGELRKLLRKITYCVKCGDPFEQNQKGRKRICPQCRLVNTSKGGAR